MAVKKGERLTLEIEKAVFGGDGLCRVDGMAVFVEGAVPGDTVEVLITRKKKDWARGRVMSLITASPDRIAAPCPYSGVCGGCKWQFLSYEKQLEYKRDQVRDSLEHIGGFDGVPVFETMPSQRIFGYRNKMEFSCSDRRWLTAAELDSNGGAGFSVNPDFACGLHIPGTFDKVLDVDGCLLQHEEGNRILLSVKEKMRSSGLAAYGLKSHRGFWRFLMMRRSRAFGKWMVNIVTATRRTDVTGPIAKKLASEFPDMISVVNNITDKRAQVSSGGTEEVLFGEPVLMDRLGRFDFAISANSFFQTNPAQAERLYDTAASFAGLDGGQKVLDLYCGIGSIALWVADRAKEVLGLELVADAVADAKMNADRNGVGNCRFMEADIKDVVGGLDFAPDVVFTDPPRSGMHPDVISAIRQMGAPVVVYVSCNPATMARDLAMLSETYRVEKVQPVDMFPHTFHVECVARLTKRRPIIFNER